MIKVTGIFLMVMAVGACGTSSDEHQNDAEKLAIAAIKTEKGAWHLALPLWKLLARGTVLRRMTNWKSHSLGQASANVLSATWVTMNGWLPPYAGRSRLPTSLNGPFEPSIELFDGAVGL